MKKKSFNAYVIALSLISTQMLCNISSEDFAHHVHHATGWHDLGTRCGCKARVDGKITNSNVIPYMKQKVINLGLKTDHFHGQNQVPDDDEFIKIVKKSVCLSHVAEKCVSVGGKRRHNDHYILRIKELCIDISHWKKRLNRIRITMDDETFKTVVNNSINWSDLYQKCGFTQRSYISERIKKLGLDTNHFCSPGRKSLSEENIFVVGSHYTNSNNIKKRLVRDHDRLYECSKCKNEDFTNAMVFLCGRTKKSCSNWNIRTGYIMTID